MIKLTRENVLQLHNLAIVETGGSDGIRDENMLDSALENAFQTFDGKDLYPTVEEKAARLGYGLISNHAFVDGNKRIGTLVMLTFLDVNGVKMSYTDEDIINLGLGVAKGEYKYPKVLSWIHSHSLDRQEQK